MLLYRRPDPSQPAYTPSSRGLGGVQYTLFGRAGFTEATRQAAQELGVRLVSLAEIERTFEEAELSGRTHI
jgi:hypothetical protein